MKIKCCKDCVAPKRHPGCHGVCPEYLYEKALWEEEKKVIREEHRRFSELYEQRSEGVRKSTKTQKTITCTEKINFYLLGIDIQSRMCYLIITARQKLIQ